MMNCTNIFVVPLYINILSNIVKFTALSLNSREQTSRLTVVVVALLMINEILFELSLVRERVSIVVLYSINNTTMWHTHSYEIGSGKQIFMCQVKLVTLFEQHLR